MLTDSAKTYFRNNKKYIQDKIIIFLFTSKTANILFQARLIYNKGF